jgi:D-glycero-D-manno-heptose 1,7-bisphosphate phosphatase
VCYHDDRDGCACRKPQPGLLLQAAAESAITLPHSFVVGDRWRDVEAGRRASCRTILIDYNYEERAAESPPDCTVRSLAEATAWILGQPRQRKEEGDEGVIYTEGENLRGRR